MTEQKTSKWSQNKESKTAMTGGGVPYIFVRTQPTVMKVANIQSPKSKCHCHYQDTTKSSHDDVLTILINHLIIIYSIMCHLLFTPME